MSKFENINDILSQFQTKYQIREQIEGEKHLENNADTWSRIANNDSFEELGFNDDEEKQEFLKEWCENNPYSE